MFRLISKSEITAKKNAERQMEIQEGLKISKQVDTLRVIKSEEERSLEQFRAATVKRINEEIVGLQIQKEYLTSSVKELEDARRRALEPLEIQMKDIEREKNILDIAKLQIQREREQLEREKQEQEQIVRETLKEHDRAVRMKEEAEEYRAQGVVGYQEALKELADAHRIREQAEKDRDFILAELRKREEEIAVKERDIALRESWVENDKADIAQERVRISDERATLERALLRLKNKKK